MMRARPTGVPRYHQIAQILRSRLAGDGRRVTEHALCQEFGVSRSTVRRALHALKQEGLVSSRAGVGTQGTGKLFARRVVRSSGDPLHGMLHSRVRIVATGIAPASSGATDFFGIAAGEKLFRITRVHELDGGPISVVRSYLPIRLAAGVPRAAWREPMHELLRERFGVRLKRSVHTIRVARATPDVASLLHVGLADPVLSIQAAAYDLDGSPVRWTENFFREDLYEYVAEMEWPDSLGAATEKRTRARRPGRS